MNRSLAVAIICIAHVARGDAPSIEGRLALGVRVSSTNDSDDVVYNDTSSARLAANGLIGVRVDRAVIGLHAGIATPLKFGSSPIADSGEVVAFTDSTIYPLDVGIGAELDAESGVWGSAWLGATVSFAHATSPAMHINAIDYTGDIPAASWSDRSTNLGFGIAVGYDFVKNEYGRIAGFLAIDSEGTGNIPSRTNNGSISYADGVTCRSLTLGVAFSL